MKRKIFTNQIDALEHAFKFYSKKDFKFGNVIIDGKMYFYVDTK